MNTQSAKRKLTAILNADVKGYSHLMGEDEEATVRTLTAYRDVIATLISVHRGRLVDSPGDNLMAGFASVVDAVQCAVEIQRELRARNEDLPESRRMEFRIGVNLGDVIEEGDRIYGDGVNVAARLESLAEAGGVCISRPVFDQVKNKLALGFEYLGELTVKNIREPIRLYRVRIDPEASDEAMEGKAAEQRPWLRAVLVTVVVLALGASGMAAWMFYVRRSVPGVGTPSEETVLTPLSEKSSVAARKVDTLASHPDDDWELREFESTFHQRRDQDSSLGYAEGDVLSDQQEVPSEVALKPSSPFQREEKRKGPVTAVWEKRRRKVQDRICGVPQDILKLQSLEEVQPLSIDVSVAIALEAAHEAAREVIDTTFHKGKHFIVPDDFREIQSAINAAKRGDIVVVKPGIYFELIVMKDGVKLVSDSAGDGNKPVAVEGARLKLPSRTLRTIIDGSKSKTSSSGMIDFNPGVGRNTIVDGFTIQNLPKQNHHIPGHPHGLNVRGASPVIVNCYLRGNGSTGIGNHVVYADQDSPMRMRDFRWANVKHKAEAVIYHNIIRDSLGLGIGCNHFSSPLILGNEVFLNSDAELGGAPSPGVGAKHGATPTIIGNIVHDNPGGGILSQVGALQGAYGIDRPTHPTVIKNVVYRNGKLRPAIGCSGGGSMRVPIRLKDNFVYECGSVGIGLMKGAVGIIEGNVISGSGAAGISINGSIVLRLNANQVTGANAPGIAIVSGSKVFEMVNNAADSNEGPRFVLRASSIASPKL